MSLKRACYFLPQNFAASNEVDAFQASSEAFPMVAANLVDKYRRSKKWRSAGFWDFSESGNTIVIQEGAYDNVEVTLSAETFSSREALLADLTDKLTAASPSDLTYTVTADSLTQQIKIAATGVFSIISTDPASQGLCEALGFSIDADYSGDDNYTADVGKIHSYEYFEFDLGVDAKPEAFVLTGERNERLNLTPFATITIEANPTTDWSTMAFSQAIPFDDKNLILVKEGGLAPEGYRYWRVKISDPENTDGYIEFNKMYLGDIYSPARGAVQFPFSSSIVDRSSVNETEYGEQYSSKKRKSQNFSTDWAALTTSEKEQIEDIYDQFGRSTPLFMIFDGNGAMSSGPQYFTRFCYFDSDPSSKIESPNYWSMTIQFKEVP